MADMKSREEAYQQLEKDIENYLKHESNFTDQQKLEVTKRIRERILGLTYILGLEDKELQKIRNKISEIQYPIVARLNKEADELKADAPAIEITADVSDVLKGLKAVQREVRETLKMLKELENKQSVILNGKAISKAVYPYTTDGNEVCSVCGRDVQTRTLKSDCGEVFTEKVCTKCEGDI